MTPLEVNGFNSSYKKICPISSICNEKGTVWISECKKSGTQVAIKIYDLDKCHEEIERIQEEISRVKNLQHKNVLTYLQSYILDEQLWIVMPLIGFTSASRLVDSHFSEGLSEYALALVIKDILQGLHYIHSKGIIHRAIKGSHILIQSNGRSLISGFRNSICTVSNGKWEKLIHSYPAEAPNNLNWSSPELLKQDMEGYSARTDIYSLGITICELGNGKVPYSMDEPQLMLVEKMYGAEPFLLDANTCARFMSENGKDSGVGGSYGDCLANFSKAPEKYFSAATHNFVSSCLILDQHCRPSAEKLCSHPFIKQIRKLDLSLPEILHPITPITKDTDLGENLEQTIKNGKDEDEISWDL